MSSVPVVPQSPPCTVTIEWFDPAAGRTVRQVIHLTDLPEIEISDSAELPDGTTLRADALAPCRPMDQRITYTHMLADRTRRVAIRGHLGDGRGAPTSQDTQPRHE